MAGLSGVYFQAPPGDAEKNKTRFKSIRPELSETFLESITETDQFFLPPQL
jgi:hypothetical protein